jgi:putative membrane protein
LSAQIHELKTKADRRGSNENGSAYRNYSAGEKRMILRDHLAHDRTVMALERTLLSYIRTSFFLITTGVTVIKFLSAEPFFLAVGILLAAAAVGTFVFGLTRYLRFRKKLSSVYRE